MSYPSFPQPQQPAYNAAPIPSFPDQQQQSYAHAAQHQLQQQPQWQQQQQQPNDFQFYSPPQQQQQQPHASMPMPSMPSHANDWNAGGGARMRPQAMHPGGPQQPHDQNVAFMPQQLISNPMAGMALDYGKASFAKNLSWVMSFLSALKYYFHVSNRYVIHKIKILLLPFLHSNWKRERLDGGMMGGPPQQGDDSIMSGIVGTPIYKAPRDDINAPDLYIPTMAFITFTLIMGYALGIGNQFHPEVLGVTASRTLILLFFEVLGLKGGLYLISIGPVTPTSLLDLVSYASYKYVHCILMILIGLVFGSWCFYAAILVLGLSAALFTMRTMKRVCTPPSGAGGQDAALGGGYNIGTNSNFGQGKHRRNYFLLMIGGIQVLFAWFLVRTASAGF